MPVMPGTRIEETGGSSPKGVAERFAAKMVQAEISVIPGGPCHDPAKKIIGVGQGFRRRLPPGYPSCYDLKRRLRILKGRGRALALYGRRHEHKLVTEYRGGKLLQAGWQIVANRRRTDHGWETPSTLDKPEAGFHLHISLSGQISPFPLSNNANASEGGHLHFGLSGNMRVPRK